MKTTSSLFVFLAVLLVVLNLCAALPPDFFRHGRPAEKRSEDDGDVIEAACALCDKYSPEMALNCRQDMGVGRKICMLGYMAKVKNALLKRGFLL